MTPNSPDALSGALEEISDILDALAGLDADLHDRLDAALRRCGVPSTPQPVGYTIWINGVQYDDLNVDPWDVPTLRRLGAIGDAHDLFVENAEWSHFVQDGVRHKRLVHSLGADVKLEIDDKPVDLGVHRRFYSTPRYISGG